ncbi:MAG: hypothetical protein ACI8QZ_001770 [Chlamydiales bacterium]|jgi:hypothetical protein
MRLALQLQLSALSLAGLISAAPAPSFSNPPTTSAAGVELASTVALDAAFAALDLERIKTELEWIASDERAGRDTPSAGLEETARYLASNVARTGLQPGAHDGYIYRYPLGWRQLDLGRSGLVVSQEERTLDLAPGVDYYLGRSTEAVDLNAVGDCVSVGDGGRSVFKRIDLKGKWAWCEDEGSSTRRIASRAQDAGALGVVFTPGADYDREPYAERFASIMRLVQRGSLGKSAPGDPGDAPFANVFLTRTAANKLHAFRGAAPDSHLAARAKLGVKLAEVRRLTHPGGFRIFENVCALWPGTDPELKNEVVILSAHYDHIGVRNGEIYNGADDNGSGSAGLLAVARALKAYGPMRRSVLIMWVSGEEKGLLGSAAWTSRPWLPEGMFPIANINIDMIGRNDPKKLLITPSRKLRDEYNGLVKRAERFAPMEGFDALGSADAYWRRSDHMNFADNLGLPVAFLFADVHADYHKSTDTVEKIDYDKIQRCTRLLLRILDDLQADRLDLADGVPSAETFAIKVRRGMAQTDLALLRSAAVDYALQHGEYPSDVGPLSELLQAEISQRDPWGNPYSYDRSDPAAPQMISFGADGKPGGRDEDADLVLSL